MPPVPPLFVERWMTTLSPMSRLPVAAISSVRFSVRVPLPLSVTALTSTVLPVPLITPPVQSKAEAMVTCALPPSVAPLESSSLPSPSNTVALSALMVPESKCVVPAPVSSKLPAMRLPALLSLRSVKVTPSATLMVAPSSALSSAEPPAPAPRWMTPFTAGADSCAPAFRCSVPPSRTLT